MSHENLTEAEERIAREQAAAHPPSVAEIMGEDLGPDLFAGPGKRSSAAKHVQRRNRAVVEAAHENAKLIEHIAEERERAENNPLRGVSSSELLAARYHHNRRG